MKKQKLNFAYLTLFCAMFLGGSIAMPSDVFAAGSGDYSSSTTINKSVKSAEKKISKGDFKAAYNELSKAVKTDADNADIHNLLGYSARKMGNYDASKAHYTEALNLDPKHKGALEYMGELYLTLNQPDEAEKLLKRLDAVCWLGCDEFDELEEAIKTWKANN